MKNIKWILLAVVLCLGLIGGAYAFWAEEIVVRGTVKTGDIDVKFVEMGQEASGFIDTSGDRKNGDYNGQNVWTSNNSISTNGKRFVLHVDNTYPGLSYQTVVKVENEGSIPVRLTGIKIYEGHGGGRTLVSSSEVGVKHDLGGWLKVAIKSALFQFSPWPGQGVDIVLGDIVLGEDESWWFELEAYTEIGKEAPQNGTMRYEIELEWEQWITDEYGG